MPIVMGKKEWSRILKWTDANKEDPDAARRREYVKYMDETSKQMCKDWPNSLENVNKRNEEMRRERVEAAEAANTNFYKKYVRRQQQEQERLMYSARDTIFKNKDAPKLLLSAVIETAIQKEREEQLKFNARTRAEAAERQKREEDEMLAQAVAWNQLQNAKKKKRFEVNKQHQQDLLEQAKEIAERERTEHEEELMLQKLDIVNSQKEMEAIQEFERNFKAAERTRIWTDMAQSKQEVDKRKAEQHARDVMDDQLIAALVNSRARVVSKRKETEKALKQERLRVLEKISQKLESGDAAREAKEQAILDKAIKEKEDANEARLEMERQAQARRKQARVESRRQFLQDEAARVRDQHTMHTWSIMNRFKNNELYEDYKEKLRLERERKTKEYRAEILRLWKERSDREAREVADRRYFYGELAERKLREADNKLLTHAASLLQEARAHGRPELPLNRAIDQYCKLYRLYPMPDLPRSLKEHFGVYSPKDGSKPDPNYKEPPPPNMAEAAAIEDVEEEQKKNGLQDKDKPKKLSENASAVADNYSRAGRANGLQTKPAQEATVLPPISAQPCRNKECDCQFK